jgi:hypothetical protein
MDKVQKPNSPECHIPSSEPFKVYLFHAGLQFRILFNPEGGGDIVLRNVGLHCFITHMTELFITTAVRTPSPKTRINILMIFLCLSKQVLEWSLKLGHDCFLAIIYN